MRRRNRLILMAGLVLTMMAATALARQFAIRLMPYDVYDVTLESSVPAVWSDDEHSLLRRLVFNLDKHAAAERFMVRRRIVLAGGAFCNADATYDKPRGTLEFRINNEPRSRWRGVSEGALREVVSRSGRWDDLAAYGCTRAA